ncbi:HAD hydrolase-like protein [Streptomyces sp. A3M-1-3]|uniref:HAD family hydrolase n=1 Tax=Streptomyces sp. A3M-1-3 TaxID=2962044 RepID=UPI0020B71184|nr:HAD family hydrolase [Streptomyces sp. A3M-1-3]MCP3821075.1 HAD hydrolase-like protein [Streptomyces sp. A3M-1-3]
MTEAFTSLVAGAENVLFDFDGPICRLFAGHLADEVAERLVAWLEERGQHVLLTEEDRLSGDPHAVLRAVDRIHPGSDLVEALEEMLTGEELHATDTAWPTPHVDPLIRTWLATGARLAIATNNSPRVVERYLTGRGLRDCFGAHIHGRSAELHLLKPDPNCLNRALASLRAHPATSLMIGDTPSDLQAARWAGVPFLGYARDDERAKRLYDAGAEIVVDSLLPLLDIVRSRGSRT